MTKDLLRGTLHDGLGGLLTCDYILIGKSCTAKNDTLEVLHTFRMSNVKNDHLPIAGVVYVASGVCAPVSRRRKPTYDRQAVRAACDRIGSDNEGPRHLAMLKHLKSLPCIPLCVDPTSHAYIFDCHILECLETFSRW